MSCDLLHALNFRGAVTNGLIACTHLLATLQSTQLTYCSAVVSTNLSCLCQAPSLLQASRGYIHVRKIVRLCVYMTLTYQKSGPLCDTYSSCHSDIVGLGVYAVC